MKNIPQKLKLVFVGIVALFLLVPLAAVIINNLSYTNPYPYGTTIDNFDLYFPNVPQITKDEIFYNLSSYASTEDTRAPESGALIREGSVEKSNFDGSFIVDFEAVQKSFRVYFLWGEALEHTEEGKLTFSCLEPDEIIYQEQSCFILPTSNEVTNFWAHSYLLDYKIFNLSSTVFYKIDSFINLYTERSTAPKSPKDTNYLATINESSFHSSYTNNDAIYEFIFTINDNRTYSATIRIDNLREKYIAIYINRTDLDNHSAAYILANNQPDIDTLTNWINSYNPNITPEVSEF